MRHFEKFARVGLIALALALATPAMADDTAQSFMKDRQTELVTLIHKGSSPDNQKKIEQTFDTILDYDALAQGSLDAQWASLSDTDKREFQDTLKKLVQRAYRKNLDRTASYDVSFEGQSQQGDSTLVRTTAKSRTNAREEPISIDYLVHKPAASWKVQDIITEGSSLVKNYRQQFSRIIKKDGFAELLKRMKTKLANGGT